MAKVTIVISDDLTDGNVSMISDPPVMSLRDRAQAHGSESLSPAEGMAMLLFAHVLTNGSPVGQRSNLILPPGVEYQRTTSD